MSDPNTKSDDKPVSAEVCAGCGLPVGYDAGECAARFDGDEVYNCDQRLIAKLRAEVEALRARVAEQAWVPCSERMPGDGVQILFWYQAMSGPRVVEGCFKPDFAITHRWQYGGGNVLHLECVTHWMPLPSPPSNPDTTAAKVD